MYKLTSFRKIYAKPPMFSCVTTNVDGQIATGSENGDIRLYKYVN